MLKELINRARGQVWLRVTCPYPERVLNLCSARKLVFWDLEWEGAETFTCCMSRGDHRILSRAAEKLDCTIEIVRREGAPYTLAKLRHRQALAVGIAACGTAVLIGSFFVWDIQIAGNETVPREVILRSLENNGVHRGCFGFALNGEDIRNHVLLELEDVVWLAVNVRGCVARVQVVERVRGQDMVEDGPANVVARRPGLVTRVEALGGQAAVVPGDTVTQGQLLISGAVDLDNGGLRWQHGMGRVWARTWYELTAQVPLTVRQRGVPLSSRTRYALDIGKKRIKLYAKGSTLGGDCDKITQYRPVCLPWGLRLPITVAAETVTAYGPSTDVPRSTREARDEGESLLRRQLEELLGDTGTAENVRIDAVEQGQWLLVTLRAECLEEIGREVPLTKE